MATWWFAAAEDAEVYERGGDTQETAEALGRAANMDGKPFFLIRGEQPEWSFNCFDGLGDAFDDVNDDLSGPDGEYPATIAGLNADTTLLKKQLSDVLRAWVAEHGRLHAWVIVPDEVIQIPGTDAWHAAAEQV